LYFADIAEEHILARMRSDNKLLTLDALLKTRNLAIDYQGVQHYFDTFIFGDVLDNSTRDQVKCFICGMTGIRFIEVPYWSKVQTKVDLLKEEVKRIESL